MAIFSRSEETIVTTWNDPFKKRQQPCPFNTVPTPLVATILELATRGDGDSQKSARLVCRQWASALLSTVSHLVVHRKEVLEAAKSKLPGLVSLDLIEVQHELENLWDYPGIERKELDELAQDLGAFTQLKGLKVTGKQFSKVLTAQPDILTRIQKLYLALEGSSFCCQQLLQLQSLTQLQFEAPYNVRALSDQDISALSCLRQLSHLALTDWKAALIGVGALTGISALKLKNCSLKPEVTRLGELRELTADKSVIAAADSLGSLTALERLCLTECKGGALRDLRQLARLRHLEIVKWDGDGRALMVPDGLNFLRLIADPGKPARRDRGLPKLAVLGCQPHLQHLDFEPGRRGYDPRLAHYRLDEYPALRTVRLRGAEIQGPTCGYLQHVSKMELDDRQLTSSYLADLHSIPFPKALQHEWKSMPAPDLCFTTSLKSLVVNVGDAACTPTVLPSMAALSALEELEVRVLCGTSHALPDLPPSLRKLVWSDPNFHLSAAQVPHLTCLELACVEDGWKVSVIGQLTSLRRLKLRSMTAPQSLTQLTGLQELVLYDLGGPIKSELNLGRLTGLRSLRVESPCEKLSTVVLPPLSCLLGLTSPHPRAWTSAAEPARAMTAARKSWILPGWPTCA